MPHAAITAYLDAVCTHIRLREVHPAIRRELADHIADSVDHLRAQGLSEAAAIDEALARLGDAETVGRDLDRTHRLRTDWGLLTGIAALVGVGLWAMWAVTVSQSYGPFDFFRKQLIWLGAGAVLGAGLFFLDYRRLARLAWPAFAVTVVSMLLLDPHGWLRWLETIPLLLTLSLSGILARWNWQSRWALPGAMLLLVVPTWLLYFRNERFGTLEYAFSFTVLFLASRPRPWQTAVYAAVTTVGGAAATALALSKPYLRMRVEALLFPFRDPMGSGYATIQSRLSIRTAGPWGQGALARLDTLPETHRDFIFPYLVYTLGWAAGAAIGGLALYFVARLLRLTSRIRDPFGKALAIGAATLLIFRVLYNLLMTLGFLPAAGVPLPLISYGPEQVFYLAALGLVLSVFRRKDLAATASQSLQ